MSTTALTTKPEELKDLKKMLPELGERAIVLSSRCVKLTLWLRQSRFARFKDMLLTELPVTSLSSLEDKIETREAGTHEKPATKLRGTMRGILDGLMAEEREFNEMKIAKEALEIENRDLKAQAAATKRSHRQESQAKAKKARELHRENRNARRSWAEKERALKKELDTAKDKATEAQKNLSQAVADTKLARINAVKVRRMGKVITIARELGGYSGHIGWRTYMKTTDELRSAIAVLDAEDDDDDCDDKRRKGSVKMQLS